VLFRSVQTKDALCDAIRRFEATSDTFSSDDIVAHAQGFCAERFRSEFSAIADDVMSGAPRGRVK